MASTIRLIVRCGAILLSLVLQPDAVRRGRSLELRVVALLALAGVACASIAWSNFAIAGAPGQNGTNATSSSPGVGGQGSNHAATDGSANNGGGSDVAGQGADGSGGTPGGRGGDFGDIGVGGGGAGGPQAGGGFGGGGGGGGGLGKAVQINLTANTNAYAGGNGGSGGNGGGTASLFPGGGGSGGGGGAGVWMNAGLTFNTLASIKGGNGGNSGMPWSPTSAGGGGGGLLVSGGDSTIITSSSITGGYGGDGGGTDGGKGAAAVLMRGGSAANPNAVTDNGSMTGGDGGDGGVGAGGSGGHGLMADSMAQITVGGGHQIGGGDGGAGGNNLGAGKGGSGGVAVWLDASVNSDTSSLNNAGTLRGGRGGAGASRLGGSTGSGGQGGVGGNGATLRHAQLINSGYIFGGAGGSGGGGSNGYASTGGKSGTGVQLTAGSSANNSGSISGGNGADGDQSYSIAIDGGTGVVLDSGTNLNTSGGVFGGSGGDLEVELFSQPHFASANGGVAIIGKGNVQVTVSGTVEGGNAGKFIGSCPPSHPECTVTAVAGDAVDFSNGSNALILEKGYSLSGNVVAGSGDTLTLGGDQDASFDVTTMGASKQYRGFGHRHKTGSSTWALTGDNAAYGWVIYAGTLLVNNSVGNIVLDGGVLYGKGTVIDITLNDTGVIAPGDAVGALHATSLTWNGGGSIDFQLGAGVSTTYSDLIALTGSLTKGSSTSGQVFNFSDGNGTPALGTSFTLITFASSSGFNVSDFGYAYTGSNAAFNGHFMLNATSLQFVLDKTPQTITSFAPTSVTYSSGGTFTASATGGGSGNPVTFSSTTPSVCTSSGGNGTTITIVAAGFCELTANQAGDGNYAAAPATPFIVAIYKAAQSISNFNASPPNPVYSAGGTFSVSATGGASGNPVTFASTTPGVCTDGGANGATISMVGSGTCKLNAAQAGNGNYYAAQQSNLVMIAAQTPDLSISIDNGREYAQYGKPLTYSVLLVNVGNTNVQGAAVDSLIPPMLTGVTWTCHADANSSCGSVNGTGNLHDTGVSITRGEGVNYSIYATLDGAVFSGTDQIAVPVGVTSSGDTQSSNNNATDTTTAVIFRDDFESGSEGEQGADGVQNP